MSLSYTSSNCCQVNGGGQKIQKEGDEITDKVDHWEFDKKQVSVPTLLMDIDKK